MGYKCLDCGNRSTKQFPGGRCPACDSFNVKRTGKSIEAHEQKRPLSQKILIAVFFALLGYWGYDYNERTKLGGKPEVAGQDVTNPSAASQLPDLNDQEALEAYIDAALEKRQPKPE